MRRLHAYLAILGIVRIADSIGALLISFVLPFLEISKSEAGFLAGIALLGMLIGAPTMGRLADVLGRRLSISLSILIYSIFTFLSYFYYSYNDLLFLRFLAGIGIGGVLPTASTAFIELAPRERRGFYVSIFESMRAVGTLLVSLVAYLSIPRLGRRFMFLFGSTPIFLVPLVLKMPESPLFLASKGKLSEASSLSKELGLETTINLSNTSLRDLKRRTLLVSVIRFSLAFSYYGRTLRAPRYISSLGFELEKSLSYLIRMSLAMLVGYYITAFLIDSVGRKKLLAAYLILSSIGIALFSLARSYDALLAIGLFFISSNAAARCTAYTYTPELYPTSIRGTAMGIAGAAARIGGFLGPLTIGFSSFEPLAISLLIASLAAIGIEEETAGKPLNREKRVF